MKLEGYKGGVNLNTINATVKRVADPMAYGGDSGGLKALGNAFGMTADVILKQQDEEDRQAVLTAMDEYNKGRYNIMYNDESGLMNTVAEGSNGISKSYLEQEQALRNDVLKRTKLHSQRNAIALEGLMNKSAQEGYQQVDRHQYKQGEAAKDLKLANNLANEIEYVQRNPLGLQESIDRYGLMSGARYSGMKGGKELSEAKLREAGSQLVGAAIGSAMQQGDIQTAQELTSMYSHFLTPQQRSQYGQAIKENIDTRQQFAATQELIAKYGDNVGAAFAAIDAMDFSGVETQHEGTTWIKKDGVSLDGVQANTRKGLDFAAKSFSDLGGGQLIVTSGTDSTDIHAAGARSHGGGWKLDVASDWLENEGNRAAFIAQLEEQGIKVLDEYSNPSPNSTGGHLDLDFTDYKGDTADSYQDYRKKDSLKKAYTARLADKQRLERYEADRQFDSITQQLYDMRQNGTSYDDALKWAMQQAGSDFKKMKQYKSAVSVVYGGQSKGSGNGQGLGTGRREKMCDMLSRGIYKDKGTFLDDARKWGANDADMDALNKSYGQYLKGEGVFRYDFNNLMPEIIDDKLKGVEKQQTKNGVTARLKWFIRDYRAKHDGQDPNELELIEEGRKATTTQQWGEYVTNKGVLWDSIKRLEVSPAQLARIGISEIQLVPGESNYYEVRYFDGRGMKYLTGQELAKAMEGR